MPFGRFEGRYVNSIPHWYLKWMFNSGWIYDERILPQFRTRASNLLKSRGKGN